MRRNLATFCAGALSLIAKHLTLPLVWCWFVYSTSPRRAALWMIAALALWLFTFAPTLPDGAGRIVERVFLYRSWPYGFQSPVLFYIVIILLPFIAKWMHLDLLDALLFTALGAMVFTYGAGSNNFYPVLLLGSVRPSRWLIPLSLSIILLVSPWTHLETMIGNFNTNNISWFVCAAWFTWLVYMRVTRQFSRLVEDHMKKLIIFFVLALLVIVPMLGQVKPAAAAECCAVPSAIYCYSCSGIPAADVAQQQQTRTDQYSYNIAMSLKAKVLFPQYAFNPTGYGQYALRYADNLGTFVPDNDVSPEVRMRLSELMATGK